MADRGINAQLQAVRNLHFLVVWFEGGAERKEENRLASVGGRTTWLTCPVCLLPLQSLDALPLTDRQAINGVWSTFSSSSHPKREIILKGLLTMCCFSQVSPPTPLLSCSFVHRSED